MSVYSKYYVMIIIMLFVAHGFLRKLLIPSSISPVANLEIQKGNFRYAVFR